jgi:hypothetical protein
MPGAHIPALSGQLGATIVDADVSPIPTRMAALDARGNTQDETSLSFGELLEEKSMRISKSYLAGAIAASCLMVSTAAAHHGWSWAEGEQSELTGTIEKISFAPPHPSLVVKVEGQSWQVDLGNPGQTQRSGFTEASAEVGDDITILGNRSRDEGEKLIKAVRITIDGKNFDMYPERIKG